MRDEKVTFSMGEVRTRPMSWEELANEEFP